MLELRPSCEHCDKPLPPDTTEAMICSYECTYCRTCAIELFDNVCPSCAGNFTERPIRPQFGLAKHPASTIRIFKPKDVKQAQIRSAKFATIPPEKR